MLVTPHQLWQLRTSPSRPCHMSPWRQNCPLWTCAVRNLLGWHVVLIHVCLWVLLPGPRGSPQVSQLCFSRVWVPCGVFCLGWRCVMGPRRCGFKLYATLKTFTPSPCPCVHLFWEDGDFEDLFRRCIRWGEEEMGVLVHMPRSMTMQRGLFLIIW